MNSRFLPSIVAPLVALLLSGCGGGGASSTHELTVMTQNVYYGAEFGSVVEAVAIGDPDGIVGAVTVAWAEIRGNDFATRAEAIARRIAAKRPDFVGLQEAALYRLQSPRTRSGTTRSPRRRWCSTTPA